MTAGRKRSPVCDARRGYTLIEAMVVLVVMAIVTSMGVPRFARSLEQTRADVAAANLRAIWTVERLYWLQNRRYADLAALINDTIVDADDHHDLPSPTFSTLLDPSIISPPANASYSYTVEYATATDFSATASRQGGGCWAGDLTINAQGVLSGRIIDSTSSQFVTVNP